jgi:hypothetical protein
LLLCSWTRQVNLKKQKDKELVQAEGKAATSGDKARLAQNAKRTTIAATQQLARETDDDLQSAGFTRAFGERVLLFNVSLTLTISRTLSL